jgi:hypothetical protein
MDPFCPIADILEKPYIRDAFRNTAAIEWMHDVPPRFGHTSDIELLIDGDSSEQADYMNGLLASSIAMFCFFLVWIALLLVFKCCGPKRVGFWSGSITPVPSPAEPPLASKLPPNERSNNFEEALEAPTMDQPAEPPQDKKSPQEYEQEHEDWQKAKDKANRRLNVMRVIVLLAGAAIIVSAGLMTSKGVTSLVDTLDGSRDALAIVHNLSQQAINIIDRFDERRLAAEFDMTKLLKATNTFCPDVREQLCTDILNNEGCDLNGIPYPVAIRSIITYFDGIRGLGFDEVIKFRADLIDIQDFADDMDQKASSYNWAFWIAAAFAITLAVLCFLVMVGVVLAWVERLPRVFYCFRMIVIVPLFVFLVLVSWVFAMVFVIGSMALADTCIDSPDGTLLTVLDKHRDQLSSIITKFLIYFISGKCWSMRKLLAAAMYHAFAMPFPSRPFLVFASGLKAARP